MNSTKLNSDASFTPHILCVSPSTARRTKLIETMDADYLITLCSSKSLPTCVRDFTFDLDIVCAECRACGDDDLLKYLLSREKVILVGDHLDQSDVAHAFDLGIIDYFPDPIDYNLLWQRIDYLIK